MQGRNLPTLSLLDTFFLQMKLLRILLSLPLLALVAGCGEPHADLKKPKSHRSGAITFDYPSNWNIAEELVLPEIHNLFVKTPGNALVILQSYPTDDADSLRGFSSAFSLSAADEAPFGKVAAATLSDLPGAHGYEWIMEEFKIDLLGESVPHRRLYGTKEIGDRKVFLIFQAATEDFSKAEPGFELIRNTLRGAPSAASDTQSQRQLEDESE